jgi:hypothetical protein
MSRRVPAGHEAQLVPLPSVLHALRSMHSYVCVPVVGPGLVVGDVRNERPLRSELFVRLLNRKARPARWCATAVRLSSAAWCCILLTVRLQFFIVAEPGAVPSKAVRLNKHPVKENLRDLEPALQLFSEPWRVVEVALGGCESGQHQTAL